MTFETEHISVALSIWENNEIAVNGLYHEHIKCEKERTQSDCRKEDCISVQTHL